MSRAKANLRFIKWPADFRRNDVTLYNRVPKAIRDTMKGNDAVCFVSSMGNQVLFVYKRIKVGIVLNHRTGKTRARELGSSFRLRLNAGTFNPEMLQNYADEVGLELVGIKRFEERYERYLEAA